MERVIRLLTLILIMGVASQMASANLSDGLVAYYPFNGNVNDESGNGNNGLANGTVDFTSGKFGQSLKLFGVTNPGYVIVPNSSSLQFSDELTISLFLRMDGSYGQTGADCSGDIIDKAAQTIVAKRGDRKGFCARIRVYQDDAEMRTAWGINMFNYPSKSISYTTPYQLGEWIHLAYVIDSEELVEYINGQEVAREENEFEDFGPANDEDLYIGIENNAGYACLDFWYPLNGAIDELRFYNRSLSQDEIQALIPEPTTVLLLGLGSIVLLRRRRA